MLLDEYLEYLNGRGGKAAGTIAQYKNTMNLFTRYMNKQFKDTNPDEFCLTKRIVKKITLSDTDGFLSSISLKTDKDGKKTGNGNNSKCNKISALKSFFKYCKRCKIVLVNIMDDMDIDDKPKREIRIPKHFEIEECKTLLQHVESRNSIRDKTIIMLFLNTGLRLNELRWLDVSCVHDTDLTVIGKGNKERAIYLNAKVIPVLEEYLKQRPTAKIKEDENALFLSERGFRMSIAAIRAVCKNSIEKAGLNPEHKKGIAVHVFRHSYATNEYQNGTDIRKLQVILGHANIGTTQLYTQVSKEQLQDQADNSIMSTII